MNVIEDRSWREQVAPCLRAGGLQGEFQASSACKVCPDDAGILYTDNLRDAFMIHVPGIRLVHIRQDAPQLCNSIAAVNDLAFFQNLETYLHDYAVAGEAYTGLWPLAHVPAAREVGRYHVEMSAFFQTLVDSPSIQTGIRNIFNGAASTFVANRWHADNKAIVMTTSVEGGGTEYLVGQLSVSETENLIRSREQQLPAQSRTVVAAPGDILVMKGYRAEARAGDTIHEKAARAILHRSFPTQGRRTVLLYGF